MTVTVNFYSHELELEGDYYKGEQRTYDYPGSPDEFELTKVIYQGVDITELLDSFNVDFRTLEQLAIETI